MGSAVSLFGAKGVKTHPEEKTLVHQEDDMIDNSGPTAIDQSSNQVNQNERNFISPRDSPPVTFPLFTPMGSPNRGFTGSASNASSSPSRSDGSRHSHDHHHHHSHETHGQHHDHHDRNLTRAFIVASGEEDNDNNADLFVQTALSLGLEGDDLLFNMMYFDDGHLPNFGSLMNTVQQETLAMHSEHNTPYKLNPADEKTIEGLIHKRFRVGECGTETECAVCKDEIEENADIIVIPNCKHYFHEECLLKWAKMQSWCPVCRSSLQNTKSTLSTKKTNRLEPCDEIDSYQQEDLDTYNINRKIEFESLEHDYSSSPKHCQSCHNSYDSKAHKDQGQKDFDQHNYEHPYEHELAAQSTHSFIERAMHSISLEALAK